MCQLLHKAGNAPAPARTGWVPRGNSLAIRAGMGAPAAAGRAVADSLADVPAREVGAPLGARSERSKYEQLSRIPEATPGKRNVDPSLAINSKTPLDKMVGIITPSDLH